MKTINDILNFFEEFAPCATQMSFDNAGLIVGDKYTAVSRVLVALDITEDVVNEAESLGCELIISHHPVIFAPIKRLSPSSVPYMLAQKGISAVCMHTNLDLGEKFGVNICLADALGVKSPVLSELGECMFTGELESKTDIHDFAKLAKKNLDCKGLRYTDIKDRVKKVPYRRVQAVQMCLMQLWRVLMCLSREKSSTMRLSPQIHSELTLLTQVTSKVKIL